MIIYELITLTTLLFRTGYLILHVIKTSAFGLPRIIMALCVNCNIGIHANQQYDYDALSMSPEIVSILEEWITRQVTDGDRICQECMNLILTELNNRNENNIGGRQLGHQSVCVWCGISISRRTGRRSRPLTDDHPERAYVAGIISPRQIPPNGRACNACWQRAHSNILQVIEPPRESQETSDNAESRSSSVVAPNKFNQPQGQLPNALTSRPKPGYLPQSQQFGYRPPQQFGYRPPQQFGYRPPQPFGYRPPQQLGYRPPPQFGYKPLQPQQFGYKSPNNSNTPQILKPQTQTTDVSMRTAQPKSNVPQGFNLNELSADDYEPYYNNYYSNYDDDYYGDSNEINYHDETHVDYELQSENEIQALDFQESASTDKKS
ncbi:uncharacterized protein LOC124636006 [Helicoverpa zea]|uniref:uncharacterized protein LOC124636006 n=1 Tax=Helicoverpa zea TaxID=7113 RepID=UPI001F55D71E|nr:uncharacterized protein LOC124636006 [Helicoverpa zea]